jgi:predicted RNA binding protein YcfA (HicA-like mRNA interferase family)
LPLCMRVLILKDIETIVLGEVVEMNDDNDHLIPPELANLAAMEGIEETMTDLIKEKEAEQILRRPPAPSAPQGPPAVAAPQIVPVAAPPGELSRAEAWILELLARTRAQESDPLWVITSSEPAVAVPARRNSAEVRQFKLRSGMNIRQVLEKIEEAGFQCLSQKGSHMKFKNEEGKVVIVPNNDAMPTGTLKSIERQVEDAKTSKQG